MSVNKLNKTFTSGQVLTSSEMNQISQKIDELVEGVNKNETSIPNITLLATKEELTNATSDKITKTQADNTYQPKGSYLTSIPDEYVTETTLTEHLQEYIPREEFPNTEEIVVKSDLTEKQDTLVSGESIKTVNGESILGSGNIVIEGTGDVTQQYVDEKLALKVDKTAYEANKATFALKTEIPSIEGLASKEEIQSSLDGKQDKGDYALKSELPDISGLATKAELASKADTSALAAKQDTLVSGENVKTINGQTILGSGNIEIQGGGSGISDAPSDDKTYGRKNENWSEIVIPSADNLATKDEISDMLTKTEAASAYQPKGEYLTSIPDEYVTETELSGKGYATTTQLDGKLSVETYNSDKATFALKSELTDFITVSVDNLVNYYKKSETYTKDEVDGKISAITTINFEVVGELPVSGEANKIYLVPNAEQGEQNVKDEYIWVDGKWEIIGSTKVDLSNYYNKGKVDSKLSAKVDLSTYSSDKETFALKSEISDMATQTWVNSQGFLTEHQDISNLATKDELNEKANTSDLGNYVTTSTANSTFATKEELGNIDAILDNINGEVIS